MMEGKQTSGMADFKYQQRQRIGEKDVTQACGTSFSVENLAGVVWLLYFSQVSMKRAGCEASVAILSAIAILFR